MPHTPRPRTPESPVLALARASTTASARAACEKASQDLDAAARAVITALGSLPSGSSLWSTYQHAALALVAADNHRAALTLAFDLWINEHPSELAHLG